MAYDMTKDKKLCSKRVEFERFFVEVSVNSYDGGMHKIQLSKVNKTDSGEKYASLGRLTADEWEKVIPVLRDCMSFKVEQPEEQQPLNVPEEEIMGE